MAILVIGIGVLATVSTFDAARATTGTAERVQVMGHIAQSEVEAILGQTFGYVGTTTNPTPSGSGDPNDPLNYVHSGWQTTFSYDWKNTALTEPLVAPCATPCRAQVRAWSDGRLGGAVYDFVTWVSDPCSLCLNLQDYKRVTVVVTMAGPLKTVPFITSTLIGP